jgi:hypothetical protein
MFYAKRYSNIQNFVILMELNFGKGINRVTTEMAVELPAYTRNYLIPR